MSLLPYPRLPKMHTDATPSDRTRPSTYLAWGLLLEVGFQGTPSVVWEVGRMCTFKHIPHASTKDRGALEGRKSHSSKLIVVLKTKNCLVKGYPCASPASFKMMTKAANDRRQVIIFLVVKNSTGFYA